MTWNRTRDRLDRAPFAAGADMSAGAFAPDARTFAGLGPGGSVWLVDVASGRSRKVPLPRGVRAANVAFSADGRLIAVRLQAGGVLLWDTHANRAVGERLSGPPDVSGLAFAPDGRTVAAGGPGLVFLWAVSSIATVW